MTMTERGLFVGLSRMQSVQYPCLFCSLRVLFYLRFKAVTMLPALDSSLHDAMAIMKNGVCFSTEGACCADASPHWGIAR
jgi:hypothetical protein